MKLKWDFIIRIIMQVLGFVLAENDKDKETAKAGKEEVTNV